MDARTFTVTELNNRIKDIFDLDPVLADVCVRGELSNYKVYPSGHHYFTLKDAESSIRCVMFKSSASKLRFRPESGMGVTAFGRVSVYPRDGAYQLYCTGIIPEGAGDLQLAFEQLKKKLSEEGLFDTKYKKPLPRFPEKIAIITSSAGAAVHDMIRILNHRWPLTKVLLLPVRVQGVEAPPEIVGAIKYANEFKVADLIITGRGGGSIEDLWAFNDERVARAVFASEIPVISAVGHEPDVTICDYVADCRASTPSNAAEIAVPDMNEFYDILSSYSARTLQSVNKSILTRREKLEAISSARVITDPSASLDNRRISLDHTRDRLVSLQENILGEKKGQHIRLAAALDALSPLKVLSRGYAIVSSSDRKSIKSAGELIAGDKISLRFSDGGAECTVDNVSTEKV
ncbi:MAG: exodeoxyribonuclease VII large subunit [Oscillospiraceae bacterium]|nr:exodeoxyribonuclease VII large subunit [Oscillospiraceae bacterium]